MSSSLEGEITYRRGASGEPLPVLRRTRLCVQAVVIAARHWQLSPSQIALEYDITETQVDAALAFYAVHTAEIDAVIASECALEAANTSRI